MFFLLLLSIHFFFSINQKDKSLSIVSKEYLKGSNNHGIWSDEISGLQMINENPWYWNLRFKILYSAILLVVIVFFYRLQLKRQLKILEAEHLRRTNQFKARLYKNITQEFQTPVNTILSMANNIEKKPNRWLQNGVQTILHNGHSLLCLINQLLELARLEEGTLKVNCIQGDIIAYLRHITESFEPLTESKGLHLHFHACPEEILMDYDPHILTQIVSNLLYNALKLSNEKGEVEIEVRKLNTDQLRIQISATSIVIPTEQSALVFDPLCPISEPSIHSRESAGFGLILCKEMVSLLQGSFSVRSQLKQSCIVTVDLPISNQATICKVLPGTLRNDHSASSLHSNTLIEEVPEHEEIRLEATFLQKAREAVQAHLDDPDLDVGKLCKILATSRTQLHNNIKALTGMSTTAFIRSIRLVKAKYLLINTDLNISQVAYECGFHFPHYFTRVFTETYGCCPSAFREEQKKQ